LVYLENQELEKAERLLNKAPGFKISPALYNFFRGYLDFSRQKNISAARYFRKALEFETELWPARFYLFRSVGKNQEEKEQMKELTEILKEIKEYINENRFDFQFMLEGFNARYFQLICNKELEWLKAGRTDYVDK